MIYFSLPCLNFNKVELKLSQHTFFQTFICVSTSLPKWTPDIIFKHKYDIFKTFV